MSVSLLGIVITSAILIFLATLFSFEKRSGFRIFGRVRKLLDRIVENASHKIQHFLSLFARDVVRQTMMYFFHVLLDMILSTLRSIENKVREVQRFNRMRVTKVRRSSDQRTIFDEIAEHKKKMALNEEQRNEKNEATLEG